MTNRPLSTFSDHELEQAVDHLWRERSAYIEEQNRRRLTKRYGRSDPDLTTYRVVASIGTISLRVKAQSKEDAEEMVSDAVYIGYEHSDQIDFDDWNGVDIDNIEPAN